MIFVEAIFAYFAASKKGWGWYVVLPLATDILCFLLLITATETKLVWAVGYLLSLLALGLMLAFSREKVFQYPKAN